VNVAHTTLHRRRLDFQTWEDALVDVARLRRAGYDRAGAWDLSQIVEHIGVHDPTTPHQDCNGRREGRGRRASSLGIEC